MEFEFGENVIGFEKVLSELDKLVFSFIEILNSSKIRYVIVSGYVAILFGRTRGTEDVDILVENLDVEKFDKFYKTLADRGFWIVNAEDKKDAFEILNEKLAIRIAVKGEAVPNFEVKYPKETLDFGVLGNPLEVRVNDRSLLISRLEVQIPYKLRLGSEKDIEDAVHLYQLFKGNLDGKFMLRVAESLKVLEEMKKYGIK
jgi:hypothetical protein